MLTFKMRQNGKFKALKCFTKDIEGRAKRQQKIVEYIRLNLSKHFVDYHFIENELWIDDGEGYEVPVTWMEWVEAPTLGEKIKQYCDVDDHDGLKSLAESFRELALWLLEQPFAHGDLKHDNLLVKEDGTLVMVDYDGMFVPELEGYQAVELGSKNYQHPNRDADFFDANLDDFSILVIYTSLLALAEKPELYNQFHNGQNIIFDDSGFIDPENNTLFEEVSKIDSLEEKINELKSQCMDGCQKIENLYDLLDGPISPEEYEIELKKVHDVIMLNLDSLAKYNRMKMRQTMFVEELIDSQKALTKKLFNDLQKKSKRISTEYENGITEEWWNRLSYEWKKLVCANIDYQNGPEPFLYWYDTTKYYLIDYVDKFQDIEEKIKKLETFNTLENINLKPISRFTNLSKLDLCGNVFNLSSICCLKKLTSLDLSNNKADLSPISALTNLRRLGIETNELDLSPISSLYNLTSLWLHGNKSSLNPIRNLINLTSLSISDNELDLSPISSLPNLTSLGLHGNKSSLHPIGNLINLTSLEIIDNELDLSPISSLPNLTSLSLNRNKSTLHPIGNLINLTSLEIIDNELDLSPLNQLANLQYLDLSYNKADLDPIKKLIIKIIDNGGWVNGIQRSPTGEIVQFPENDLPF